MLIFALVLASAATSLPEEPAPPAVRFETYATTGADGARITGELGRIFVPEDRAKQGGAEVEIAFVRFRTRSENPGPPVFYLAGGPGASGVELCVRPATGRLVRLLDSHDVIGIDQRGTGLSRPNLAGTGSFAWDLPLDRAITRDEMIAAATSAAERCVAHWKERGVDLAAYHTDASADDIEAVRRALDIERIITWGESYGTHLSLAYLRRHGGHVARSVLLRVEGPDHTLKLPSTTQRHLERFHELVAADPSFREDIPDVLGLVKGLLVRLTQQPVPVVAMQAGGEEPIVLGAFDLQYWLSNALGLAFAMRDVPAALLAMSNGDWTALGTFAIDARRGETGSAMALAMDCASGASAARLARIEAERRDPANLLGDAVNVPYPSACAPCGPSALGETFRAPIRSDVPVLFVSGDLDARTPPENVDEIRAGFARGVHVLVRNAGHEPIEMMSAEFRALLGDFLAGRKVESRTIELPAPRFRR